MNLLHINLLPSVDHTPFVEPFATTLGKNLLTLTSATDLSEQYIEDHDIDMVVFSCHAAKRVVRQCLSLSRDLRVPYLFLTDNMSLDDLPKRLLVPVTMLEEEVYKAEIVGHLVRYFQSSVLLLCAHDYGSKARQNTNRIRTYLTSLTPPPSADAAEEHEQVLIEDQIALKDSFHLYKEVTDRAREFSANFLVWTASREYGLDDIFFGPPEQHIILRSASPVLLINPRADLFSLCD